MFVKIINSIIMVYKFFILLINKKLFLKIKMKKVIYLFIHFSLLINFYEIFSFAGDSRESTISNFSFFLPLEIMEKITEQLLLSSSGHQVEDKKIVRKALIHFALVNKNFYLSILEVIFRNQ